MHEDRAMDVVAPLPDVGAPAVVATARAPVEYVTWGEGPAVLALHGAMGGWDQSMLLARTIGPDTHRYVALSRPGYLGTPLSAGRTPEEQADLYAEALDLLGIGPVSVMAVSGGGPSAIHFALRHRERCRGLVLVSTTGGPVRMQIPAAFHVLMLLARWPGFVGAMRRRAERDPEGAARRALPDPAARARLLRDPEASSLFRALSRSTFDRMALRIAGTRNDIGVTRSTEYPLERIAVPTLVVHGTADRLVPFARHGKALAGRIPGAELLAIEGGEHAAIFTHRAEVRARVVRFLAATAA